MDKAINKSVSFFLDHLSKSVYVINLDCLFIFFRLSRVERVKFVDMIKPEFLTEMNPWPELK